MILLEKIWENLQEKGTAVAYSCETRQISYQELGKWSGRLCAYLKRQFTQGEPVLIYGHKQPVMAAAFLACVFGGFPYIPVDSSTPKERVQAILHSARPQVLLAAEPVQADEISIIDRKTLEQICEEGGEMPLPYPARKPDEIFYIIYTSGSTGVPKGVMVTCENLDSFTSWMMKLFPKAPSVIVNQASFSFDLSVADFWPALAWGAQEYTLCRQVQKDYPALFSRLEKSGAKMMVLTPSFASLLLADQSFCAKRFPGLDVLFFCGETLLPKTARALLDRFPGLRIINAYGPTECTVAVTAAEIGEKEASQSILPVGIANPGVEVYIENGGKLAKEGEEGEIILCGDSVAAGYIGQKSHASPFGIKNGKRYYRTGDLGWIQNGVLYCKGRLDSQVKLRGYRVELQDVEQNLSTLPGVEEAVVVSCENREGQTTRLVAFVQLYEGAKPTKQRLQALLAQRLPVYMCPIIRLVKAFPLNENGKCDRKRLKEAANGRGDFEADPRDWE